MNLGNKDVNRSDEVKYREPPTPYSEITLKSADRAWQNRSTGVTLSYLSVCRDNADPDLEVLRDNTLRGIESLKLEKDEKVTYNGREGLRSYATGSLDGIKVAMRLLIFKKNFCNYTISMVGVQGRLSVSDEAVFTQFLEGFVAP